MSVFDKKKQYYGISAQAYLERTRTQLLENTHESLFYAALELRCCVEARQAEYVEHLSAYKGQKVCPYQIGENRKKIAKISGGELIARLQFNLDDGQALVGYHTPVPASLTQYCERHLDNLRHTQPQYRPPDDPWWDATRTDLIKNYRQAWVACQGNMLVPPLWSTRSGKTHPVTFEFAEADREMADRMKNSVGEHLIVEVKYLESPPQEWVCDL